VQPGITIVLAGARNAQQAIENAGAMNIQISETEKTFIKEKLQTIIQ